MLNFDKSRPHAKRLKSQQVVEVNGARIAQNEYADDSEDLTDYVPVPFKIVREKHAPTSEPCWGCINKFRKPEMPGEYPLLDNLWNVLERNVGSTSYLETARLIGKEFRRTIYEPMREEGKECMEWPDHVILRHIEGRHTLMKNAEIAQSILALSNVEKEILDGLFMHKDGAPGLKFDDKRIDSLCKIVTTKQKLLASIKD
jgi:hypothetical protein